MRSLRFPLLAGALIILSFPALADPVGAPAPKPGDSGAPPAARATNETAPPDTNQAKGETPPDFSDTLTGDWGGLRTKLAEHGLNVTVVYHGDVWGNLSGGIKQGAAYDDDTDLQLSGDGEKLYGLKGSSFFIYGLNNAGGHPNENLVGSAGGIDNLEVTKSRPKLFEAWVQQTFFDEKLSILAGLYDTDTEFNITDSSVLFLNPTYGTSTEFGATGVAGPAAFPESSSGGRILVKPIQDVYVQAAAVGGHPRDPGDPNGLRMGWGPHAGVLLLGEAGYKNANNGHYAIGGYHFTSGTDNFDGSTAGDGRQPDNGVYAIGERALYTDPLNKDRQLSGFLRLGYAEPDFSPFNWSWATGVSMTNVLPSRKDSQAGIAVGQSRVSHSYFISNNAAGMPVFSGPETQFEITYADKPIPWLTLQPDIQYTVNPALDRGHDDALTVGMRAAINF